MGVLFYSGASNLLKGMARSFLGLAILVLMVGCGSDSSGPDPVDNTITSVTVTPASNSLVSIGATAQLAASGKNSAGTTQSGATFAWSSSNEAVATVSSAGLVTAVSNGTATITATATGTTASAAAQVTVQQTVALVAVSPQDGSMEVGATVQLSATATDSGGVEVTDATFAWTSSDDAVATVSSGGLVAGKAGGPVTITATSAGIDGSAPVTVVWTDIEISEDTNLSGTYMVDEFKVVAGVTVTATADLTIDATGQVEILGTITGDCVDLTIQGDTAVTVKGTLNNGCAAGVEGEDLTVQADGELTLEDATIVSSGEVFFSNDPTLAETDFPESGPSAAAGRSGEIGKPRKAGSGIPYTFVNRTTVRYAGGQTGPDPAKDGVDGSDGDSGRPVKMWLRGNAEFAGNTLLWGQDAGHGGDQERTAASDVSATGGKGGDGGKISVFITGSLMYSGAENIVRSGDGGWGGDAEATATPSDVGFKAPSATSTGGAAGGPGLIDIRAGGGLNVANGSALVLEVGVPGLGGDAKSTGADGEDATSATGRAQDGGDATSTGGAGGSTPAKQLVKRGDVTGSDPILRGASGLPLDGGVGGEAESQAGEGGNGIQVNKPGGDGGMISSTGGAGGDALLIGLDGIHVADGGIGGTAWFYGGNGGDGFSDCVVGQSTESGGAGGKGGSTSGNQGAGGLGLTPGDGGGTHFENVGNGGNGGDGEGPGAFGEKGTKGTITGVTTEVQPAFQDGVVGADCPPPGMPVTVRIAVEEATNENGVIQPNVTQGLPIEEIEGSHTGSILFKPIGAPFSLFVGNPPPRLGLAGGSGNELAFDLSSIFISGYTVLVAAIVICAVNTSGVGAENPVIIEEIDVLGNTISRTDNSDPVANSCTRVEVSPQTRSVRIRLLAGALIDILAPTLFLLLALTQPPASG